MMNLPKVVNCMKFEEHKKKRKLDQMKQETKILAYLSHNGYKHSPKLFFSGFVLADFLYFMATENIKGKFFFKYFYLTLIAW